MMKKERINLVILRSTNLDILETALENQSNVVRIGTQ